MKHVAPKNNIILHSERAFHTNNILPVHHLSSPIGQGLPKQANCRQNKKMFEKNMQTLG